MENRITFKSKNGYYLELLTPETMKLLGNTDSKIFKDKNSENVPHLEITEVVLFTMTISKIQEFYIHLLQTNHLIVY